MYGELLKDKFPMGELEKKYEIKGIEDEGFYRVRVYSTEKIPVLAHKTNFF
jgi:hypothetical protein